MVWRQVQNKSKECREEEEEEAGVRLMNYQEGEKAWRIPPHAVVLGVVVLNGVPWT